MKDTPEFIMQKQFEIIYAKPISERWQMAVDMSDFGRAMVEKRVRKNFPHFDEIEVKVQTFKEFYVDTFSESQMEAIAESMRKYWKGKIQNEIRNLE